MTKRSCVIAALLALALPLQASLAASISLPADTATYQPSTLPGYEKTVANCMLCHSAQYARMQPTTSPRGYWEATVKKMKKPFGAPLADEDIPLIVDYLVKTYGAERPAGKK